jgi:regulator of sigma E protease
MMTAIIFLIVLSVLVLVHEWGHFIVAKKCGMKVHEFGWGFPPRAFGVYKDPKTKKWVWVWGKGKNKLADTVGGETHQEEYPATLYSVNWLPLGGFVKIKGENGEDAKALDSFAAHPAWKRAAVLVAGVIMNFILAAVLLGIGFIIGIPMDMSGGVDEKAIVMEAARVSIQQVEKDSPAEKLGLKFGDTVVSLNSTSITSSEQMRNLIKEIGFQTIAVEILREGKNMTVTMTPIQIGEDKIPRLGVMLADAGMVRFPWYIAMYKGVAAAFIGLINIFIALFLLIKGLVFGQGLSLDVSGPVGIATVVGQSARMGIQYLISVSAMISLSLAAINILPIPALDGGRLLFVLIEKVIRRPVPMRYEQLAHTTGFVLLMALIIVVTYRDIARLF